MPTLKLAVVVGAFPKLSETFVLEQIQQLLAAGHDVSIFAFERSNEPVRHPAVDELGLMARTTFVKPVTPGRARLWAIGRGLGTTPTRHFDAILCHFGHIGEQARALREHGVLSGPLAVIFHAYDLTVWLGERGDDAYRRLFAQAELLLPISEHWRAKLLRLGAPAARVRVMHMGIDCSKLRYEPRAPRPEEPLRLLSIGRFVEKKGFDYALEAVALSAKRSPRPIHYAIVGDGPLRGQLEHQARALGDVHVTFHGALANNEVQRLMRESHALLAPSVTAANGDMEGIPVVLMEAMAHGLSVLTTHHSGIPELVRDGVTGRCVPERDVPALAEAISAWATSPEDWRAMTDRARRLVETEFDSVALSAELGRELSGLRQLG